MLRGAPAAALTDLRRWCWRVDCLYGDELKRGAVLKLKTLLAIALSATALIGEAANAQSRLARIPHRGLDDSCATSATERSRALDSP
jgi:hypothetical protein